MYLGDQVEFLGQVFFFEIDIVPHKLMQKTAYIVFCDSWSTWEAILHNSEKTFKKYLKTF